ncbi:MAG: GAF domain-containing sensor histidine kinase, partial [Armatimonadetes bacterium]|nr:GAF domain-containing sensor histidine kinase [Anaerolineae bacterium]
GALLEAFASQVSVALTNAHLHEEVTHHSVELEQRIRDLMVVYHTGQALTATLDLRQIYRLLYQETAAQLFGASIMRVLLFDPKTHGLRYDSLVQHGNMIEPALLPLTPEEQMALQVVVVQRTPYVQDNAVYAPLISDRKIIGVLQILHETPNYFANLEFTLLATLSNLAAIAIANAQLYLTVNSQRDEMTALYRATTALFLGEDIETLAQQIAETIVIEFNQSDCGVMLVDAQHKVIERIARAGSYAITPKATLALDGFGLVPEAVRTGQMVYASNTKLDPRYVTGDARTHSELVIPLISARGVIGVLDLQSMEREAFMEQDRRVLQAYAERVAAALENTLLLGEVRRHTAELERRVVERTQDLRAALQQERTLNEMKSRFVKTVSHQFRSPLTTIQAAKDLLNRYSERMTTDERIERFETIDQSVKAMVRLLEDAITINNLTEDTVIFDPMLVDIHPLTQALVTQFAAQRGQQYRIIYTCVLPQVMATVDLELWQRMIVELLTNAVKFSPRHSLIECQLLNDGGDYLLIVSDQGMGIPEDDLERVFGIFDRGANVENVVGAGLGLMIVRQIIRRHHGDVSIRSRLGQGTTVTLRLPKIVLQDELTLSNRLS